MGEICTNLLLSNLFPSLCCYYFYLHFKSICETYQDLVIILLNFYIFWRKETITIFTLGIFVFCILFAFLVPWVSILVCHLVSFLCCDTALFLSMSFAAVPSAFTNFYKSNNSCIHLCLIKKFVFKNSLIHKKKKYTICFQVFIITFSNSHLHFI